MALQKINSTLPKTVKWHRVSNWFFKLCSVCTERAPKAICFSLQFYCLEALDQDRTLSGRRSRTHSFHQGVICWNLSSRLEVAWRQRPNQRSPYNFFFSYSQVVDEERRRQIRELASGTNLESREGKQSKKKEKNKNQDLLARLGWINHQQIPSYWTTIHSAASIWCKPGKLWSVCPSIWKKIKLFLSLRYAIVGQVLIFQPTS